MPSIATTTPIVVRDGPGRVDVSSLLYEAEGSAERCDWLYACCGEAGSSGAPYGMRKGIVGTIEGEDLEVSWLD